MKLLFQSDDYGISSGVTDGILKGIKEGIIRNTGLFVNMPSSEYAANKIKDIAGINVGIDINYVAGCPISNVEDVKSLVDQEGHFISSTQRMKDGKVIGGNGIAIIFEEDPFDYQDVLLETENQVKKFIELMGRKPAYLHGHSIGTPNTARAAKEIAEKYGISQSMDVFGHSKMYGIPCTWTPKPFPIAMQFETSTEDNLLRELEKVLDKEYVSFVAHCGYVDDELIHETTYTIIRIKDLAAALSPKIKEFISSNNIELITHEQFLKEVSE